MGTTRRPAWLRGAPARPAGAGGKTVIASWDTSMTTSVSVSLTKWVSLNELEWERGRGGVGDLNADQVKRCYEFHLSFHSLYGVFLSDSWCMPDNSKKGLLTGKLGQRRWGTKHYISVLWQFLFSSQETNCIIRQRQAVCLQSYYSLFESDHNFLSH